MFDLAPTDVMPSTDLHKPPVTTLFQSSEFKRAMAAFGRPTLDLAGFDDLVITRRQFSPRLGVAMINRAELSNPAQLLDALRQSTLRRTPVILSPQRPMPELADLGALPVMSPASVALLDLEPCTQARHRALHQKWRNRLVHAQTQAQAQNLRITRQNMPLDSQHWLFAADHAQQQAHGYHSWPIALTLAYAQQNKGQAKLFQLMQGNTPLAAVLILRHDTGASYHISHTSALGRLMSAHNLLMWEAMNWLAQKGCRQLDLGVINTEDAPGLARFKLGTGAKLSQLGGTWLYWSPLGRMLSPLARLDRAMMTAM